MIISSKYAVCIEQAKKEDKNNNRRKIDSIFLRDFSPHDYAYNGQNESLSQFSIAKRLESFGV